MKLTNIGLVSNEESNYSIEIYYDRYDYIVFIYKDGKDYKSFRANDIEEARIKINKYFSIFRIMDVDDLLE